MNKLGNGLLAAGINSGERLVWCGPNSLEVLITIHAARKCNLVAVPLSYRFNAEEMQYVIDNSDATAVVVDADEAELVASVRDQLPKVKVVVVFGGKVPDAAGFVAWDDVCAGQPDVGARDPRHERSRRRDDLYVGHHGETQGCTPHLVPIARSCSPCSPS